jgi:hypothetical protein
MFDHIRNRGIQKLRRDTQKLLPKCNYTQYIDEAADVDVSAYDISSHRRHQPWHAQVSVLGPQIINEIREPLHALPIRCTP